MVRLSVVMGVYNGAPRLAATLDSILAQSERDFELIAVDDGSTDETPSILAACAMRDSRLRILRQENKGLTPALIRGCGEARAPIIARHDAGDVSLPERFAKQLAAMRDGVVLASCWTRVVGPEGEPLLEVKAADDEVRRSLLHDQVDAIRGLTHHGSAMFLRDAYLDAGGYRDAFRYAQDLDLWVRLAAQGAIAIVPEVLYEATYDVGSISAARRADQIELARIALAIRDGGDEAALIQKARRIGTGSRERHKSDDAAALYFIASCLRRNGDARYRRYARAALRRDPLHLRAWLLLVR